MQKLTKAQLQLIRTLTLESKERVAQQQVVVYGSTILKELSSETTFMCIFTTEEKSSRFLPLLQERNAPHLICSEEDMQKISGQKSPEGIGAVIALPPPSDLTSASSVVILDQIQDPGNLGTLVRSAYALGMEGIIFVKGGCDPFSEKALRSSQGAIFHLPYSMMEPKELHQFIKEAKFKPLVADMEGESIEKYLHSHPESKLALVLGNEGQGVLHADPHWQKVAIPMQGNAESLNVAIAGSILMYRLCQKPLQGSSHASV